MIKNLITLLFLVCLVATSCVSRRGAQPSAAKGTAAASGFAFTELFYDATKLRLQNDNAAALAKYKLCLAQQPQHGASNYYAASLSAALGEMQDAVQYCKAAVMAEPNNLNYQELLATVYTQAGDAEQAAATYVALAKQRPALAEEYLSGAGYQLMRQGKLQQAYNVLQTLEQYQGTTKELSYRKVYLLRRMNKTKDANALVDVMMATANKSELVRLQILKLNLLDDAGEKATANALLADLARTAPDDANVVELQVERAIAKGDTTGYLLYLDKLVVHKDIAPERKADLLLPLLSIAAQSADKKQTVLQLGRKLVNASPSDSKAIQIYANILEGAGKQNEATAEFAKLVRLDAKNYDNWRKLLSAYGQLDEYDSMIVVARRALDYFPNQAYLHYMQGYAYQQNQQYDNALKSLRKADDYSTSNTEVQLPILLAMADVYNSQGKYIESDNTFERALKIEKNNATVLNNYAYFLSIRGEQLDKALSMSIQAIQLSGNEKTFIDTYAWVLYKQGKYSEALAQQQTAIAAPGDNDATMYEHLGDIHAKLNETELAVKNWQLAKTLLGNKTNSTLDKKIQTRQLP